VKYGKSWTFKSKKIKRCIAIKVTGSISYTERVESAPHSPVQTFHWQHQTLRSPALTIRVFGLKPNGRCGAAARLVKVNLRQAWTGYACNFNPSLSFSAPRGISISGWPSCGKRNQAGYRSSPPRAPVPLRAVQQWLAGRFR
jgi:hypothetical protein